MVSRKTRTATLVLGILFAATAGITATLAAESMGSTGDVDWKMSGEARFRPEYRDNRDLTCDLDDDTRQGFMRLRLGVEASYKDDYRVFFQAQDSRVAGEEPSTAANTRNLDLHQGYLELRHLGSTRLSLTLGRQEWKYGEERLVGAFGWDNVGRSFDGARLRYKTERSTLDGLLARVTDSSPAVPTEGTDFYGVEWANKLRKEGEYDGYYLGVSDSMRAAGETGAFGHTSIHAFGARMKDAWGKLVVNAEAAVETGEVNGDDLSAFAGAVFVAYRFGTEYRLRPFVGYDFATGDEDPADGERQEFFNFFPTNHGHYGYADFEGWRNLRDPYVGVTFGHGRHTATAKHHWFQLDEAAGAWKDAGGNVLGFDPTGSSGRDVGTELDLVYTYKMGETVSVMGGYSWFNPGDFAEATRGPDPSNWAFVMLTAGI